MLTVPATTGIELVVPRAVVTRDERPKQVRAPGLQPRDPRTGHLVGGSPVDPSFAFLIAAESSDSDQMNEFLRRARQADATRSGGGPR